MTKKLFNFPISSYFNFIHRAPLTQFMAELLDAKQQNVLISEALAAMKNAYMPYSKFPVGAALLNEDGQIFRGVNVENASYGATICAERSAICNAMTALGPSKFRPKAIAVATDLSEPGSPCGICRQSLAEFDDMPVFLYSQTSGKMVQTSVHQLLPMAFMPKHLSEYNDELANPKS